MSFEAAISPPDTVIDSVVAPTASVKSTVVTVAVLTITDSRTAVLKPVLDTVTLYRPGARLDARNAPSELVPALLSCPVSRLRI